MEVSALNYSGGLGLHGRSPLLRLQSDERLIGLIRRGNDGAFEALVSRYNSRLLAFCRHMLGSREDAEDILQDVMAAAYNAILADERPINVRPWLYRIARNRSLNHLRRAQAVGVDSMDVHLHSHGATTADKVHEREEFRLLVSDIQRLPESQRTALVLREMDALSYDQIAEAMETTVPSVKSLLVRARIGLAEAAEARLLSCAEVRIELGEVAEGLIRKPSPLVRRHVKTCVRCTTFQLSLKETSKSLAVVLPVGSVAILRKLALTHFGLGHSAGSGAAASAGGAGGAGAGAGAGAVGAGAGAGGAGASVGVAAAGAGAGATGTAGSLVSAGVGALAGKAAAGIAAAALVTAGAVEVDHSAQRPAVHPRSAAAVVPAKPTSGGAAIGPRHYVASSAAKPAVKHDQPVTTTPASPAADASAPTTTPPASATTTDTTTPTTNTGTTTTTTVDTVLPPSGGGGGGGSTAPSGSTDPGTTPTTPTTTTTTTSTTPTSTSTTPTSTTPTGTTTSPQWGPTGGGG